MKFAGVGGYPKALVTLGVLKSSISSLRMIPVEGDLKAEPKYKFTVEVRATALRCLSTVERWVVPLS